MNYLINSDSNTPGIFRVYILHENSDTTRIYTPGIQINPINSSGGLDSEIYDKNKLIYPKAIWCSNVLKDAVPDDTAIPGWIIYEAGDMKKPIVIGFHGKGLEMANAWCGSSVVGGITTTGGNKEINAKKIFYLYNSLGVPNVNISGILGNYEVENGIDPTTVEAIYDEPYNMGPKKQAAESDWHNFTIKTVFALYDASGTSIGKEWYKGTDNKYYPGIAMNSATGENARLLLEYAKKMKMNWYSLELQLMFNLESNGTGLAKQNQYDFMTKEWNNPESSASAAAIKYGQYYEHAGISSGAGGTLKSSDREKKAQEWLSGMSLWEPNLKYGYYLIKTAGFPAPKQASNFDQNAWDTASESDLNIGGNINSANWCYPLNSKHTLDPTTGGRAFGASRDNGNRAHAGMDLIVAPGVKVIACTSGSVDYISYNFFAGTDAIVVRNSDGSYILYGECEPSVSVGDSVNKGDTIGKIIANDSAGSSMLHIEVYAGDSTGNVLTNNGRYKYVPEKVYKRRNDLCDPTFIKDLPMCQ